MSMIVLTCALLNCVNCRNIFNEGLMENLSDLSEERDRHFTRQLLPMTSPLKPGTNRLEQERMDLLQEIPKPLKVL